MLQIKDICKEYRTGDLLQKALDHVSLTLRDNEFVAILGPSGSGKTTLLNIVGGLDRYDSGDLVINGVSTKKYKDRDWDSYRNHTIGFVFQSYNLIMHQSVLANVELALTISGISGSERRRRAEEALGKVGLAEQGHKKPSQLSGGQMQRVAIARALVNDPDIVLADEPTGALDTETSIQVMNILKEVAKDRLVVMVTHNPDLAREYATRIVNIKDGKILSDTNPPELQGEDLQTPVHKNLGRASMSFLTALSLSGNNLRTKKARTLLVSFAGSIGIIGIALILALSNGANRFIQTQESETLAMYPLQIEKSGFDLTSMMESMGSSGGGLLGGSGNSTYTDKVGVSEAADLLLKEVKSNDLGALKTYLDSDESDIGQYVNAVEYNYGITPQIYSLEGDSAEQMNPNHMFDDLSAGSSDFTGMMSSSLGMDFFNPLPQSEELYRESYDLKAGNWPEKDTDLVLVLSADGTISDIVLYATGLRDQKELESRIQDYNAGKKTESSVSSSSSASDEKDTYSYQDFLGKTFRLVNACDYYTHDDTYDVWTDHSGDKDFVRDLVKKGETLTITGIVQPKEGTVAEVLSSGICFSPSLEQKLMQTASQSEVVKDQLSRPEINVLTGKKFTDEKNSSDLDLSKLFSVDEEALQEAFSANAENISPDSLNLDQIAGSLDLSNLDLSGLNLENSLDPSALQQAVPSLDSLDLGNLLSKVKINVTADQMQSLFQNLADGYLQQAASDPATDYAKLGKSYSEYLQTEDGKVVLQGEMQKILQSNQENLITREDVAEMASAVFAGYLDYIQQNPTENPLSQETFQNWLNSSAAETVISQAMAKITGKLSQFTITQEQAVSLASALQQGYDAWASQNGAPELSKAADSFAAYLQTDEARSLLLNAAGQMIDTSELQTALSDTLQSAVTALVQGIASQVTIALTSAMSSMTGQLTQALESALTQTVGSVTDQMSQMFQIDPDQLASAFRANMDAGQLQELMSSMLAGNSSSLENNLTSLGYADPDEPIEISIYPKDFNAKNAVVSILKNYNEQMKQEGQEDKVITYTDMVTAMMSSVTRIIDTISYILIAFVAISLVVSSIMIGVITYISVLERRKEIGVLRALGASRHNIAQVFNAETFITGLLAGGIGVLLTVLLTFPVNALIFRITGQEIRAALSPAAGGILIALSIVLTMIAGLIPSRKAAKSDPVAALRSE